MRNARGRTPFPIPTGKHGPIGWYGDEEGAHSGVTRRASAVTAHIVNVLIIALCLQHPLFQDYTSRYGALLLYSASFVNIFSKYT